MIYYQGRGDKDVCDPNDDPQSRGSGGTDHLGNSRQEIREWPHKHRQETAKN